MRKCAKCKKNKMLKSFHRNKTLPLGYSYYCKECNNIFKKNWLIKNVTQYKDYMKKWYRSKVYESKNDVFNHYSNGSCSCCGESVIEFLTIDHIGGGGNMHRRSSSGKGGGVLFYRWLKKNGYPDGYQVLCFNCNWGKYLCGECPHKVLKKIRETAK